MWIITVMSCWVMINMSFISPHIQKITEGKNRPMYTPFFTAGTFIYICIFGVFCYLFLNSIRRVRYVQYLANRLDLLNFGNYDDKNKEEILSIERQLKLIELKRETKRKKLLIWK